MPFIHFIHLTLNWLRLVMTCNIQCMVFMFMKFQYISHHVCQPVLPGLPLPSDAPCHTVLHQGSRRVSRWHRAFEGGRRRCWRLRWQHLGPPESCKEGGSFQHPFLLSVHVCFRSQTLAPRVASSRSLLAWHGKKMQGLSCTKRWLIHLNI